MATKNAMIRARVEAELKAQVESIFKELGLTTTEAITLFYHQVRRSQGLPFELKLSTPNRILTDEEFEAGVPCPLSHVPNKETRKALRESAKGIGVTRYDNIEDMFRELDLECST